MTKNKISEGTSIKQMIQGMQVDNMEVMRGIVISASPLKIQVENDEKLVIGSNSIYIPKHLTDYITTVDIKMSDSMNIEIAGGSHAHSGGEHEEHVDGDGSHLHNGGAHSHTLSGFNINRAEMTVHNALKAGDKVHILSFNYGKQYYVLDRIE